MVVLLLWVVLLLCTDCAMLMYAVNTTAGCKEAVRTNLDQIVPRILTAAVDSEPLVRECACFCLGQLSEHCQPDILDYHAVSF
jgi:HEAT repeat